MKRKWKRATRSTTLVRSPLAQQRNERAGSYTLSPPHVNDSPAMSLICGVASGLLAINEPRGAHVIQPPARIRAYALALVGVALALFAIGEPAAAACYNSQQQIPAQTAADFRANPPQLLQQNPDGGTALVTQVRDLVASDQATLTLVVALIAKANHDQLEAIGRGLAQA